MFWGQHMHRNLKQNASFRKTPIHWWYVNPPEKKDANVNGDPHPIWIENKDISAHQPVL